MARARQRGLRSKEIPMQQFASTLNPLTLLALGAVTLVIPLIAVVGTSFVRIAVVLNLLRQAIGAQNVPPTYVLNVVAAALTVAIMVSPVSEVIALSEKVPFASVTLANVTDILGKIDGPLVKFMTDNTGPIERDFIEGVRRDHWSDAAKARFGDDSLFVILPAFVMSEVKKGFEIGFLIYIPFVIIDVVVATIISSLGMSSVSPNIIGLMTAGPGWPRTLSAVTSEAPRPAAVDPAAGRGASATSRRSSRSPSSRSSRSSRRSSSSDPP